MARITRRTFAKMAAAIGASAVWGKPVGAQSRIQWHERRDLYPEGVASGDPDSNSVLLWTRRPYPADNDETLLVEVAEDQKFRKVVATARALVSKESDWTCRVLVGGLKPARVYCYRFTDRDGAGSRIGRTITAPAPFCTSAILSMKSSGIPKTAHAAAVYQKYHSGGVSSPEDYWPPALAGAYSHRSGGRRLFQTAEWQRTQTLRTSSKTRATGRGSSRNGGFERSNRG
jgi:phosphodiesterase/alkaline phosphatase D-like protein